MRKHVVTTIRLPEDLHERVKQAALRDRRTTNNYIGVVLEEAVNRIETEHPEQRRDDSGEARCE